jgi:hypothetical protein
VCGEFSQDPISTNSEEAEIRRIPIPGQPEQKSLPDTISTGKKKKR